jgi:type II secretory pathway pseudopilin PulG
MGNRVQLKRKLRAGGFTMAEVVLALAVVAFGLVAVLGVLPIGLNTNRDNRYETMIVQDVEYWMNAIRGGRLSMDTINNVEWVQVNNGTHWFKAEFATVALDPFAGGLDEMINVPNPVKNVYIGQLKQSSWPKDVIGWLSTPDTTAPIKRARVRPFGGTLMNRLHSIKDVNATGHVVPRHDGHDLTFSYLLETHINKHPTSPGFWEIKMIAKWPIIEEIYDPTTGEINVTTGHGKRTFITYINAPPTPDPNGAVLPIVYGTNKFDKFINLDSKELMLSFPPGESLNREELMGFLLLELGKVDNGSDILGLANDKTPNDIGIQDMDELMLQLSTLENKGSLLEKLNSALKLLGYTDFDSMVRGRGLNQNQIAYFLESLGFTAADPSVPDLENAVLGKQKAETSLEKLLIEALNQLSTANLLRTTREGSYMPVESYDSLGRYSLKSVDGTYFEIMNFFRPPLKED